VLVMGVAAGCGGMLLAWMTGNGAFVPALRYGASASAVGLALACGFGTRYGRWIIVAVMCCFAGDWLLAERGFLPGLIAFLIGHIAFITAFSVRGVSVKALALAGAALTIPACAVLVWLHSEVPSKHLAPVVAYLCVISLMAAFAFATSARRTAPLITLGALAFYVSDLFVARTTFIQGGFINALLGLPLYYASLVLFALSTVPVSREEGHDASSVIQFGSEEHTNNVRGL
jgi:uncharacterized membrane protein YhhN